MATVNGGQVRTNVLGGQRKILTFSGTVKLEGSGVVRTILGYKIGFPETVFTTTSASDGSWSLNIPGGTRDFFRFICVGAENENSVIFDRITG